MLRLTLLLLFAVLATNALALQAEPTCWFPQPHLGRGLRAHYFTIDRVLVWGVHVDTARNISVAPMDNWLTPVIFNGAQPTEFPAGAHPNFYPLVIPEGRALPDHGLAWVLLGHVGRVHESFFTEDHLCRTVAHDACAPELAGFCNGLDACADQAACDLDSRGCAEPSPDAQLCPADAFCNPAKRRCDACRNDTDCSHDWCAGTETTCHASSGTCVARGPMPCSASAFGCDSEAQRCRSCSVDADCVVPSGQFCSAVARCERGQCEVAARTSPCPGQICVESQRRCIENVMQHGADDAAKPLILGADGEALDGCREDADCWDRPTSDYLWCDGGIPYCDLDLRQCTRHAAPTCGSGTCDSALDTCTGCYSNADCGINEFWCRPRLCDHSAGLCIPAPESRCGDSMCLESARLCAQDVCTQDANCTSTFCGGQQKCNLSTGACYVVPGSVPCQGGIQGCDESGLTCTAVSTEWTVVFATLGGLVFVGLLAAACCIVPYCGAKRLINEDSLYLDEYALEGRRGGHRRGGGRGRGRGWRGPGRGGRRGRWGVWTRRGPVPWWWYDPYYQPTFWDRLTYGIW